MKEKLLIHQGDPCDIPLDDPAVQTVTDAQAKGHVLNIYSEATEKLPGSRRWRVLRTANDLLSGF